jgi:hypothetical protein
MELPGVGLLTGPDELGWLRTEPIFMPLMNRKAEFVLEGFIEDHAKDDFTRAAANFLRLTSEALRFSEEHVFAYYQDVRECCSGTEIPMPAIASPREVWAHVQFGSAVMLGRRQHGEGAVYVSLECECDWEPEHGLQLVFLRGERLTKVGPFDGHLSNADAFANPALETVVYVRA